MAARLGLAVVFAAGCWTSSGTPPPISNAGSATSAPVAAQIEVWLGTGVQPDANTEWPIEMTIRRDAPVGERLGTIDYPTIGCKSELIRQPDRGKSIVALERLTEDPQKVCADGGTIVLTGDGDTLDWRWSYATGEEAATSTLRRKLP